MNYSLLMICCSLSIIAVAKFSKKLPVIPPLLGERAGVRAESSSEASDYLKNILA
jgi:hypothetical protein